MDDTVIVVEQSTVTPSPLSSNLPPARLILQRNYLPEQSLWRKSSRKGGTRIKAAISAPGLATCIP